MVDENLADGVRKCAYDPEGANRRGDDMLP